ncbi:MAG: protease [Bacteroidetes bacterium]|nr:MAG: protease [Bacteroidota bacterium]REK06559.1 MAG: protease [Bacteroidota bacterium]REK33325.1 MAG: protease [Bacteroidota bacterium]REK49725.1 MAG: protease [Bacteroidota bacterium]
MATVNKQKSMNQEYIESLMNDIPVMSEISNKVKRYGGTVKSKQWGVVGDVIKDAVDNKDVDGVLTRPYTEAIIAEFGRPALLIQKDDFVVAESDEWNARLMPTRNLIRKAIKGVGRIELHGHPDFPWVGTGWHITEDVIVTNRHVAMEFGFSKGKQFVFKVNPDGDTIKAKVDFREEYRQSTSPLEYLIEKILYISKPGDKIPDVAFLKLKKSKYLPEPLNLKLKGIEKDDYVCTIGYPARDGRRNDESVMEKIFGDIYNVKRLQPGQIMMYSKSASNFIFHHDCSTLGGNSGSAIVDILSGQAVGLHFGGRFKQTNYAVKINTIIDLLKNIKKSYAVKSVSTSYNTVKEKVSSVTKRKTDPSGYIGSHLGSGFKVPLPDFRSYTLKNDVVELDKEHRTNRNKYELKYEHFSVVMSKSRRLPIFSACNINGSQWYKIPRKNDTWYIDNRIPSKYQIDNKLYKGNDLDRGHMTRREDPVWGATRSEASIANEDTFHYTNCCPQHKDLNQNKQTWQGLENYILDNARNMEFKVNVFTGPVFTDRDKIYRGVPIPKEFWKVIVIVTGKKLWATGYLLSQNNLLGDLGETVDFKYGRFKTFQVSIEHIEKKTRLNFKGLSKYDPLNKADEGFDIIELSDYSSIKFDRLI